MKKQCRTCPEFKAGRKMADGARWCAVLGCPVYGDDPQCARKGGKD